jgi:hypothetical protein
VCEEGNCQNAPKDKQRHLVMCAAHYKLNTALIPDFIKKLHAKELPKGCSLTCKGNKNLSYACQAKSLTSGKM